MAAATPRIDCAKIVESELELGIKRSPEYRRGVLACLERHAFGEAIGMPYRPGTASADAFFAGLERGDAAWRRVMARQPGK